MLYQGQFTTVSLWPTITDFKKLLGVSKSCLILEHRYYGNNVCVFCVFTSDDYNAVVVFNPSCIYYRVSLVNSICLVINIQLGVGEFDLY